VVGARARQAARAWRRTGRASRAVTLEGDVPSLAPGGETDRWIVAVADRARLRIVRARVGFVGEDRVALAPDAIAALGVAPGEDLLITPFDRPEPGKGGPS